MSLSLLELPLDPVIMVQRNEREILAYNIDMDNVVQFVLPLNYETYILYQQMVINYYKKKHQHTENELSKFKMMYQSLFENFKKVEGQCKSYIGYNQVILKSNQQLKSTLTFMQERINQKHYEKQEEVMEKKEEKEEEKKEEFSEEVIDQVKYENFTNHIYIRIRQSSQCLTDPSKIICFDRVLQKLNSFVNQYIFEEYKIRLDTGFFYRIFFQKENTYADSIYYAKSYESSMDSYFHHLEHFIKNDSDCIFYLNEVMIERLKRYDEKQIFTKFLYNAVHLTYSQIQNIWIQIFDYFKSNKTYEAIMEDNEKYKNIIVFYPNEKQKRPLFMLNYDKKRNKDVHKHQNLLMIWF